MVGEIWLIGKDLYTVYGIDEYIFSDEDAAVIATRQIAACQELFKVIFPKALEDLKDEPSAACAVTELLEFETMLTVLPVAGIAGAVGSAGVEPGFSTGGVGGVGRLAAGATHVPGPWKMSPTPFEPNTGGTNCVSSVREAQSILTVV